MRDDVEIKEQVAALKRIKPRVLRRSSFGDDHHAAIDGQIRVLENKMDDDAVFDVDDAVGLADNVRTAMLDAVDWLNDRNKDTLDGEWEALAR